MLIIIIRETCDLKDHLHGAMHRAIDRPIDRQMHLICIHTNTIDRAICSVPLAATGWTNRKSRDDRSDVRSNTDRATKNQALTGDLRCIARCVGHSNCPVYTVRSGRFRSIARCIAPCKWVLKLLVNLCMPFDFILIDELLTKTFYHPEQR